MADPITQFLVVYNDSSVYDYVYHIIDTTHHVEEKDSAFFDEEYQERERRQEQKVCGDGSIWTKSTELTLKEAANKIGFDKTEFEGEAPEGICSKCWKKVIKKVSSLEDTPTEKLGNYGFRLRWKQKDRARKEWYDLIVSPDTTLEEIDSLLLYNFSTLSNAHVRMYGLEGEYVQSSLEIMPKEQYEKAGYPSYTKATEITIGELSERYTLWTDDRLSMAYDLGHPSRFYCIFKEALKPEEVEEQLQSDTISKTETAAIVRKKPSSSRSTNEKSGSSEENDIGIRDKLESELDDITKD